MGTCEVLMTYIYILGGIHSLKHSIFYYGKEYFQAKIFLKRVSFEQF